MLIRLNGYKFDCNMETLKIHTIYAINGTTIAFDLNDINIKSPFNIETSGGSAYNEGLVHVATDGTVTGSSAPR